MYDPDDIKTIKKLLEQFGRDKCLRLGLLGQDDNATIFITTIGLGYLLDVEAVDIKTLHEAYVAGFKQGYDQAENL